MQRHRRKGEGVLGITMAAVFGFAGGVLAGIVAGEFYGAMSSERLLRRWQPAPEPDNEEPSLKRAVERALRHDPGTRRLPIAVEPVGAGRIALVGTVPTAQASQDAERLASRVSGVREVLNRVTVAKSQRLRAEPVSDAT